MGFFYGMRQADDDGSVSEPGETMKLFAPKPCPIGVDIGSENIKLVQFQNDGATPALIAAGSCQIAPEVRNDSDQRNCFVVEQIKKMLAASEFRGRKAIISLPATSMFIHHLRINKMSDAELVKVLPWEVQGKLPFDASAAMLRHVVAGEIYGGQEAKNEVILMAASRSAVAKHLAIIERSKLEIQALQVEPSAIIACFSHLFRRKSDENATTLFLDIGASNTKAIITHGHQMVFAKNISIAGERFTRAVSGQLNIPYSEAQMLRVRLAATEGRGDQIHEPGATPPADALTPRLQETVSQQVNQAIKEPLAELVRELQFCIRYYESVFPARTIDRILFVGGEAQCKSLCQHIAKRLHLPASVGDPMARINHQGGASLVAGVDRRLAQPAWSVAVGLSLGLNKRAGKTENNVAAAG